MDEPNVAIPVKPKALDIAYPSLFMMVVYVMCLLLIEQRFTGLQK